MEEVEHQLGGATRSIDNVVSVSEQRIRGVMIDIDYLGCPFDDRKVGIANSLGGAAITYHDNLTISEHRREPFRYERCPGDNRVSRDKATLVKDPNRESKRLKPLSETARRTVRVRVRINVRNDNDSRS
jgi:hypothetical protein